MHYLTKFRDFSQLTLIISYQVVDGLCHAVKDLVASDEERTSNDDNEKWVVQNMKSTGTLLEWIMEIAARRTYLFKLFPCVTVLNTMSTFPVYIVAFLG